MYEHFQVDKNKNQIKIKDDAVSAFSLNVLLDSIFDLKMHLKV